MAFTRAHTPPHTCTQRRSPAHPYTYNFQHPMTPLLNDPLPPKLKLLFTYLCKAKIFKTKIHFVKDIYKI